MHVRRHRAYHIGVLLLASLALPDPLPANPVDDVIRQGTGRVEDNATAQRRVERLADQRDDLLAQYRAELAVVDGLRTYNRLLTEQVDGQAGELAELEASLQQVADIERQILPLLLRMTESLKTFVELDLPFLLDERRQRLRDLDALLDDAAVPVAERMRKVLEAYQIELEYGRTIETFDGSLTVDGRAQQVDMLRVGRVALIYRTLDRAAAGVWNSAQRDWQAVSLDTYGRDIERGMRLAQRQAAPDLLLLPVPAPDPVASGDEAAR